MVLLLKILERSKIYLEYAMQSCILRENNNEMCRKGLGLHFMLFPSPWGQFYIKINPNHPLEQQQRCWKVF